MPTQQPMPSFAEVTQTLHRAHALMGPSETHGLLCGIICSGNQFDDIHWLKILNETLDTELDENSQETKLLKNVAVATHWQLRDINFSFQLLLPTDDEDLQDRAYCLTSWCQGFLCGLGLGGFELRDDLPADLREGLEHMAEISRLDVQDMEVSDEDEASYMEVSEYIRALIFAMFDQFSGELANQHIH